jgi:hypothetical protein
VEIVVEVFGVTTILNETVVGFLVVVRFLVVVVRLVVVITTGFAQYTLKSDTIFQEPLRKQLKQLML